MARTKNQASADTVLRQWQILQQIPKAPSAVTVTEIEERLSAEWSVTRRTIERDLVLLEGRFPLVCDDSHKPHRWSWLPNAAAVTIPSLTAAQAMTFALVEQYLERLIPKSIQHELSPFFRMAQQRLSGLPESVPIKKWKEKVRVVVPTQALLPPEIDGAVQEAVYDGLLRDKTLRLQYRGRDADEPRDYLAHPLAVVQRGAVTYLVCTLSDGEQPRLLALHRIHKADVSEDPRRWPGGFDVDSYLESGALGFGEGAMITLKARFTEEAGKHLFDTPLSETQQIKREQDGHILVTASVPDTRALYWWLLGFGAQVEVLQPKRLRKQIIDTAVAMQDVYSA